MTRPSHLGLTVLILLLLVGSAPAWAGPKDPAPPPPTSTVDAKIDEARKAGDKLYRHLLGEAELYTAVHWAMGTSVLADAARYAAEDKPHIAIWFAEWASDIFKTPVRQATRWIDSATTFLSSAKSMGYSGPEVSFCDTQLARARVYRTKGAFGHAANKARASAERLMVYLQSLLDPSTDPLAITLETFVKKHLDEMDGAFAHITRIARGTETPYLTELRKVSASISTDAWRMFGKGEYATAYWLHRTAIGRKTLHFWDNWTTVFYVALQHFTRHHFALPYPTDPGTDPDTEPDDTSTDTAK